MSIQKNVLKKILDCGAGRIAKYFNEWKSIPDQSQKSLRNRVSVFERSLDKFVKSKLKSIFDPFK
jgi:hypothetical protein